MDDKELDNLFGNLSESDKDAVFKLISSGCFTKDKTAYFQDVERIVDEYKKHLGSQKLKQFWKDKTGTESPYDWSEKYRMPILIMVPEEKIADYRKHFSTISSKNPEASAIESAQLFFNASNIWDDLNDASVRDKRFRETIIGDKSVMLRNIDEVKDYLAKHITDSPYYWVGSSVVKTKIEQLAQSKYLSSGYSEAFEKIDKMEPDKVKQYLKDLIKNNMNVGIEIIKDK